MFGLGGAFTTPGWRMILSLSTNRRFPLCPQAVCVRVLTPRQFPTRVPFFFCVEESTSQQGAHMRGAHIFLGPHLPPLFVFGTVQGLPSGHFPPFRGVKKRTDISHCGGCQGHTTPRGLPLSCSPPPRFSHTFRREKGFFWGKNMQLHQLFHGRPKTPTNPPARPASQPHTHTHTQHTHTPTHPPTPTHTQTRTQTHSHRATTTVRGTFF